MIAIKKALYMTVPLLTVITSCVQANDNASSGSFTIGLGGRYAPRYSGSDKQVWQVVPVFLSNGGPVWRQALPEYLVWRESGAEPAFRL